MDWNNAAAPVFGVGELNEYVRRRLAADPMLRGIRLRGEISGFKRHSAGHLYFTVKDENAAIAAVMFRQSAYSLTFEPRDGQRVILTGSVSIYVATGKYQFYVDAMEREGEGELYARFEKLKQRLMQEGLFDASHKQPIPMLNRRIGVITSRTGAVIHDICTVAERRDPSVTLELYPVAVQGDTAAGEIARALRRMDRRGYDVIIVGRGGGSIEDLWPFNEETVARAIYECRTPVISAVGHEVDFTIADFVADVRAATPSVAAELAVADRAELVRAIGDRVRRLSSLMEFELESLDNRLARKEAALELHSPRHIIESAEARRSAQQTRLNQAALNCLNANEAVYSTMLTRLMKNNPIHAVDSRLQQLTNDTARLDAALDKCMAALEHRLDGADASLKALDPQNVIRRGYAVVSVAGRTVSAANEVSPGDTLAIHMRGGDVDALALGIREGDT